MKPHFVAMVEMDRSCCFIRSSACWSLRWFRYSEKRTPVFLTNREENEKIANLLNSAIARVMETEDLGIKTRSYPSDPTLDYYGVIRHSVASGCPLSLLAEHGFHTNPEDSSFLQSEECLARLAVAEAEVIDKFLP